MNVPLVGGVAKWDGYKGGVKTLSESPRSRRVGAANDGGVGSEFFSLSFGAGGGRGGTTGVGGIVCGLGLRLEKKPDSLFPRVCERRGLMNGLITRRESKTYVGSSLLS
jgi:hypothetical protein